MQLKNTQDSWGDIAKLFHWLIALLVIGMIILGAIMGEFDKPTKMVLVTIHKSTGLTILGLMVLRLLWRLMNPTPRLPATTPTWQKGAAHLSHWLLYLFVILMPITGWVMSTAAGHPVNFWWLAKINVPWVPTVDKPLAHLFSDFHSILAWVISTLIVVHIGGALKHYFIDKDEVLKRMCPHRE